MSVSILRRNSHSSESCDDDTDDAIGHLSGEDAQVVHTLVERAGKVWLCNVFKGAAPPSPLLAPNLNACRLSVTHTCVNDVVLHVLCLLRARSWGGYLGQLNRPADSSMARTTRCRDDRLLQSHVTGAQTLSESLNATSSNLLELARQLLHTTTPAFIPSHLPKLLPGPIRKIILRQVASDRSAR